MSDEDRALRQALQSLVTLTQSVTELRNSIGIDHGAEEVRGGYALDTPAWSSARRRSGASSCSRRSLIPMHPGVVRNPDFSRRRCPVLWSQTCPSLSLVERNQQLTWIQDQGEHAARPARPLS